MVAKHSRDHHGAQRRSTRRQFLHTAMVAGSLGALGQLACVKPLAQGIAHAGQPSSPIVSLPPDIEPLVQLLERTPRDQLLETVGQHVQQGLSARAVLGALMLAGVRNIQPRPVGFKFHAVMVVQSVHLASLASPKADRWVPLFWALDYFKQAQARDAQVGDWAMAPIQTSQLPPAHQARQVFTQAMDHWDVSAADTAIAGLARTATPQDVFDLLSQYGARDFRDIGHKAIYLSNGWRTLQAMGWQYAEPVLRSLAYAFLAHEGTNPAQRDADADRPYRQNQRHLAKIRAGWQEGQPSDTATTDMLATLRQASADEASSAVVDMLNRGIAPQSIWDALFSAAAELVMRRPGIIPLHAVTTTNAIHFAFQHAHNERTKQLLLLQNAAFMTMFRGAPIRDAAGTIDQLQAENLDATGNAALDAIFVDVSNDTNRAARRILGYLQAQGQPERLLARARQILVSKGNHAHDYKYTEAVLEDYTQLSPSWRGRYLAACATLLLGSERADSPLLSRIRASLKQSS